MVKPHSPIAECRHSQPPVYSSDGKTVRGLLEAKCIRDLASSPKRPRKSVTFSSTLNIREVVHRNNLTEDEFRTMWLTAEEFEDIKTNIRHTLKLMRRHSISENDDSFCWRGLDCRTREGHNQRSLNKQQQRQAVFSVQAVQRQEGLGDPDFIAIVSSTKTAESAKSARLLAVCDEEEARKHHNEISVWALLEDMVI